MLTISKENEEKLQREGIDVDVTASASLIGKVDVEVSTSVSKTKENIAKLSKSVEERTEVAFGSKPPADGKMLSFLIHRSYDSSKIKDAYNKNILNVNQLMTFERS